MASMHAHIFAHSHKSLINLVLLYYFAFFSLTFLLGLIQKQHSYNINKIGNNLAHLYLITHFLLIIVFYQTLMEIKQMKNLISVTL